MFEFIYKQYPENFVFLVLRILELFTSDICIFFLNWATFEHILWFLYISKQKCHISQVRITQKVNAVIMQNLRRIVFM